MAPPKERSIAMFKQLGLAAIAAASIACNDVGTVKFELAIDNDNDRTADVTVGAGTGVFTMDNVIVILDRVVLKGDGIEAVIIDTPTPFRFDALDELELEVEVAAGAYTSLEATLGVANAATAAAADEPNIEGRSFHLEGNLDGIGIVTYAPAAQTITFTADLTVEAGAVLVPEILIDLQDLVTGVDYALAEDVDGELALTEDNAIDQTPIVAGNVAAAWTLIIE
jgi:hypothetical protein